MQGTDYAEYRLHTLDRFATMRPVAEPPALHLSPSGQYTLEVSEYADDGQGWSYSRGIVTHSATGRLIADVTRNYGHFWFAWIARDDGEFLLCGEDYQGYNIIDLQRVTNTLTFPTEAYDGGGFCWAEVHPSPSGRIIAVDGCFWASQSDLVFYDFSDPTASPLPELGRVDFLDKALGQTSDTEFSYSKEKEEDGEVDESALSGVWTFAATNYSSSEGDIV